MKINFVSQGYDTKLCGQACLAMITGKTLGQVCDELGKFSRTSLLEDLRPYLNDNIDDLSSYHIYEDDINSIVDDSIILLSYPNYNGNNGHFIIKHNDLYYDPAVGIIKELDMSYRKIESVLYFNK